MTSTSPNQLPINARIGVWRVESLVRRRFRDRLQFESAQEREEEVKRHRLERGRSALSGHIGLNVDDAVALPLFIDRVSEWGGELQAFSRELRRQRLHESHLHARHATPSKPSPVLWTSRIPEQYAESQDDMRLRVKGREKKKNAFSADTVPESELGQWLVPSVVPVPPTPLPQSPRAPRPFSDIVQASSSVHRHKCLLGTTHRRYDKDGALHLRGRTTTEIRREDRRQYYDFEQAQTAHLQPSEPHPPPRTPAAERCKTRVGKLTLSYPFPRF